MQSLAHLLPDLRERGIRSLRLTSAEVEKDLNSALLKILRVVSERAVSSHPFPLAGKGSGDEVRPGEGVGDEVYCAARPGPPEDISWPPDLRERGIRLLRLTSAEVEKDLNNALLKILPVVSEGAVSSHPFPARAARGEGVGG